MDWIRKWTGAVTVMVLVSMASVSQAQTFSEWFRQKKTQQKYLLEQIAALEVYAGYLKKGYKIVDGGLTTIRDITGGEFKLHEAFISSLKKVSPAIRGDARVVEIISLQVGILKAFGGIKGSDFLSAENLAYIALVSEQVINECYKDLEELLLVVTSGKLEMKDDERLERLESVYQNMLDKSAFAQDFTGNVSLLIRQRQAEAKELDGIIRMYFLKE